MHQHSIYVASPLGFNDSGMRYLVECVHPQLQAAGLSLLDPWADPGDAWKKALATEISNTRDRRIRELNVITGARNAEMIRSACVLLAILDGVDVDSGTAAEIGYAAAYNVPVVGLRTDIRVYADNDQAQVNLQVEYFITESGSSIYRQLDKAVDAAQQCVATRSCKSSD